MVTCWTGLHLKQVRERDRHKNSHSVLNTE
jgi:hypothetical protein